MKKVKPFITILTSSILVTILVAIAIYYAVSSYVMNEAKENLQNLLLSHRGVHHYIQRVMHPAFFTARDLDYINNNYYSPEIFSSSYMVRVLHGFYNEERLKSGLHKIYYKMAADNPRNPVNKSNEREKSILKLFNEKRQLKEYEEIVTIEGKRYLFYAMPFLETTEACLRCHGKREDSPVGLQSLYKGQGGFGDELGNIRAIESILVPLEDEMNAIYILSGSMLSGLIVMTILFVFNTRLQSKVKNKTKDLEAEISVRKNAENKIIDSLQEKEILLQEVHHRVKNNMAIISSFLDLKSATISDQKIKQMFRDSQQRIKSMALVHEKLYRSDNFRDIKIREYFSAMFDDLVKNYNHQHLNISCHQQIEDISFSLDLLIPVGLIVNEIFTNAIKHAFSDTENPKISIELKRYEDTIHLKISDNGIGFKENDKLIEDKPIGLEIIKALVQQIRGSVEINSHAGTEYAITFPLKQEKL